MPQQTSAHYWPFDIISSIGLFIILLGIITYFLSPYTRGIAILIPIPVSIAFIVVYLCGRYLGAAGIATYYLAVTFLMRNTMDIYLGKTLVKR